MKSANQKLADKLLGRAVDQFITERRDQGRSWRLIARDLFEATGGEVDVTDQTLRSWMVDPAEATPPTAVGQ